MNLVIDIGNTLVKYAIFNDKEIIKFEKSDDFDTKIIDDLLQKIKTELDNEGIEIPFPQLSIHMNKEENNES